MAEKEAAASLLLLVKPSPKLGPVAHPNQRPHQTTYPYNITRGGKTIQVVPRSPVKAGRFGFPRESPSNAPFVFGSSARCDTAHSSSTSSEESTSCSSMDESTDSAHQPPPESKTMAPPQPQPQPQPQFRLCATVAVQGPIKIPALSSRESQLEAMFDKLSKSAYVVVKDIVARGRKLILSSNLPNAQRLPAVKSFYQTVFGVNFTNSNESALSSPADTWLSLAMFAVLVHTNNQDQTPALVCGNLIIDWHYIYTYTHGYNKWVDDMAKYFRGLKRGKLALPNTIETVLNGSMNLALYRLPTISAGF